MMNSLRLLRSVAPVIAVLVSLLPGLPGQARMDDEVRAAMARAAAARGVGELPATMSATGTYEVVFGGAPDAEPVAKGELVEIFRGADRARITTKMGELGAMERGITPELAWEVDPMMGAKRYDGAAGETVRRYFRILRGERPESIYSRIVRRAAAEGAPDDAAPVFECFPPTGAADVWRFDAETMLVTKIEMLLPSPDSAGAVFDMKDSMPATLTFADWREVAGHKHAFERRMTMGPAIVTARLTRIEAGVELPTERFAAPEAAAKLKPRIEAAPIGQGAGAPEFAIVERDKQPVASIRVKCKPTEISATLARLLPEVMAQISASGGKTAGAPFSRYHGFAEQSVDIEAGIPVAAPIEVKGRVVNSELPGGRVVTGWHIGPYEKLTGAHNALQQYLKANQLEADGGPWEIYWTDPGMVPDSSKWRTQLFVLLKPRPAK